MTKIQKFTVTIPNINMLQIQASARTNIESQKNIWLASFIHKIEKSQIHSPYLQKVLGNNIPYH